MLGLIPIFVQDPPQRRCQDKDLGVFGSDSRKPSKGGGNETRERERPVKGVLVQESPLRAAETPWSWGLRRYCIEHTSELVHWGEEAGYLPLHCFPSLGVSPGGPD